MLNFIGCGSAFNTELGNNGAYIKKDNILFLIDCGSSTFGRIQKAGLLEDVDNVCVLLTHTHADHVGSLGDLILYGYYAMGELAKPSVWVFSPFDLKIRHLLDMMGVKENTYNLVQFSESSGFHHDDLHIGFEPVPVKHVEELSCFGYIIHWEDQTIYYSGDSSEISANILHEFYSGRFDLFYQDTCKADYEGNVHLSLRKLDELIHSSREKVFCMHLDENFDREEAEALGFNVVSPNSHIRE